AVLRTVVAGTNATVTQNATTIEIAAGVATVANEGGGAQVYDTVNSTPGNAVLRTVIAGTNATVTQNATTIEIAAGVATVANEGGGAQVYDTVNSTPGNAVLRTLVAGTATTVTQNATTISLASNPGFYTRTVVAVPVYAVLATDDILAVTGTTTTNVTLNLPQIAALSGPKRYSIVDEGGNAFVHPIIVVAFAGDTIIGQTTVRIENNHNSINIYHNGTTGWFIA
ncbi:MAG: hypothetical protein WC700_07545, partial [Gemmatimonadaceae bacterium]